MTRDSPWDDSQVAALLVAMELRHERGSHGQPMAEALDPLADPMRPGGWHYEAHRRIDRAQRAITDAQADITKKYPDYDTSADVWTVEKVWD